jgi:hypothetical protein
MPAKAEITAEFVTAIFDGNRPLTFGQPQLLQALLHDAHRLVHLFHSNEIAIVAVAVLADWDVEIELGIAFVGLRLPQVPGGTGAAHHAPRLISMHCMPRKSGRDDRFICLR